MSRRNLPYLPLYVQDFMTDEKLMECSAAATGVYIRLMCVLHKGEEYGRILLKQKYKQSPEQILNFASQVAKFLPFDLLTIQSGLKELLDENVIEIDGDFLFQKRMVKDADISEKRASSGKKGGDQTTKKKKTKSESFAQPKTQANTENEIEDENSIDTVRVKEGQETIREGITLPWESMAFEKAWSKWISYSRKQHDRHHKTAEGEQLELRELYKLTAVESEAIDIIEYCISKTYKHLRKRDGEEHKGTGNARFGDKAVPGIHGGKNSNSTLRSADRKDFDTGRN